MATVVMEEVRSDAAVTRCGLSEFFVFRRFDKTGRFDVLSRICDVVS